MRVIIGFAAAIAATTLWADTRVRPDVYLENVKFLASEKLKGRGTGMKELDIAADYIAKKFKSFGLKPVPGAHDYGQAFTVTTRARLGPGNKLQYTVGSETKTLKSSKDFVAFNFSENGKAAGQVVFAGYGITAPEYDYDDYAGIDVKGKIVVVLRQEPQEFDEKSKFEGKAYTAHSQFANKAVNAKMHGAKAVIFLNSMYNRPSGDDKLELFGRAAGPGNSGIPFVQLKVEETAKWFEIAGKDLKQLCEEIDKDLKPRSFAFPDSLKVDLAVDIERQAKSVRNVSAFLPGQTDEYVVIGAHYDHLGFGEQFSLGTPGQTHPGADDNASGTSGVIELARYFSKQPKPKRGILFLAFAGEELGLLGSAYYVSNPYIPLNKAVAMINMDMIGRIRDGKVFLAGSGTGSSFKNLLAEITPKYPDFKIDLSETAGYGSSDHTSFTTKQVPVLFFFSGLHGDYHKPSDTWDKIDANNASKLLDLVADITVKLTDGPERPQYVRVEPPKMPAGASGGSGGYGPYFGSIPDFSEPPTGVRFADVRAGSPAEKGGLKGGDIMIEFDGKKVGNLQDYTYLLRQKKPGDEVTVKYLRNGQPAETKVVLTKRN
jgi:hypothetical protein